MTTTMISTVCPFLLLLGLTLSSAFGKETGSSELKLTTERVIVFKDGYCLVVKQGTATTDAEGLVHTKQVPDAAILGSFWAIPEKGTIKSMTAGWVETVSETKRTINCQSIIEIVEANLGKQCSFAIGDDERVEGVLIKVLSNDRLDAADAAEKLRQQQLTISSITPSPTPGVFERVSLSTTTGNYFLLKTHDGDMMVAASAVKNLTIVGMSSTLEQTVTKKSRHKRISIDFGKPNSNVKINLIYFRPGVRWIPTYRINLTDAEHKSKRKNGNSPPELRIKVAEIFMQGEIINEAEDLIDVPFHVVVGVPNFRFRSVPSPMVLESSIRNLLAQAAPNVLGNRFNNLSNAIYTQRASEFQSNRATGDATHADVSLPKELTGSGGNDLFVYELPKMTIKKGERATVPILKTKVAYRDVYTWEIDVTHSETYAATSAGSTSPLVLTENKIWRQVELINDTEIPWTTGAAMFMDGLQPLAQELLTYTSPGGICRVPVTVSVDLRGKVNDREVKRTLKALRWRNHDYARIEGKIDVELANNKMEAVPVEVQLRFGGKATRASDGGKISLESFREEDWNNRRGDPINNSSLIRWKATIEPGECFKPLVDYEFWLRY